MFDLSLPWTIWLLLPYLVTPYWALAGSVLGGVLGFRRRRRVAWGALGALAGSQLVPWLAMLAVGVFDGPGAGVRAWGLGFVLCLAALVFVLWAVSRAQTRRRGGS
jgi:hypothetical protein